MPKIIVITGSTNSHKTGSAREFATKHMTSFRYIGSNPKTITGGTPVTSAASLSSIPGTGDFVAEGTCTKSGNVYQVGIASAGDDGSLVDRNLSYFKSLPHLDIIVICSKSKGVSVDRVIHHLYDPAGLFHGSSLHVTRTFRFPAGHVNIPIDQARVVNDVFQFI